VTELTSVTSTSTGHSKPDGPGIARGAAVLAGLTILARILGLVRTLVFSQTVGATCLGTAYVTANQVPSLVYELVLAGALSSAMVPVLARSAELAATDPAEKARVRQISSALLTWTVIILVPFTLIIVAAAGPIASVLNPANPNAHCVHADVVATTASMLRVFAPQALLYGLSVVLFGLLQAYRRFAAYALAPAVYSLVLIGSYLAFAPLSKGLPLAKLPTSAQLILSVGTTAGVALMVVVGLVPTWRLRLRLHPVLRFPPGVARRAAGLVLVGLIEVAASDIASVVVIALANGRGTTGALVIFNYAAQVFNTLNAVLAVSVVLSAFPVLSARDGPVFDRTCAGSTRAVLLVTGLGMALTAAVTVPAAHVLAQQPSQVPQLIQAFLLFAPGLAGMGVIANLSRVMLVIGRLKIAAVAVAASWLVGMVLQVVLAEVVPARLVVAALALGQTVGQISAAIPLIVITRRIRGTAAIRGIGRAWLAGLGAAVAGGVVGAAVSLALPVNHKLLAFGDGVLAALVALVAFGVVGAVLDRGDMRAVMARAWSVVTLPRRSRRSA
jgi:putative peptidoglycan lipid II flippase